MKMRRGLSLRYCKASRVEKRPKILKIIKELGNERGMLNEDKVSMALQKLKDAGGIHKFFRTKRYSRKDINGIDFVIIRDDNARFSLQVKSSVRGIREHQENFPDVLVLLVEAGERVESIERKIRQLIGVGIYSETDKGLYLHLRFRDGLKRP